MKAFTVTPGRGKYVFVECDGRFAECGPDEALWVCAKLLMGESHCWLETYEQWAACGWNRLEPGELKGLLPAPGAIAPRDESPLLVRFGSRDPRRMWMRACP